LPESEPWFLELVGVMDSKGLFDHGPAIIILEKQFADITAIETKLVRDSGLSDEKIIATILAIKMLESDEKAKSVCAKAIKKAWKALEGAGVDLNILKIIPFPLVKGR
jgi:hypothetical protein